MSVIKAKRHTSTIEFLHNALNLRKYVVFKLLKDFGLKDKVRDKTLFINSSRLDKGKQLLLGDLLKQCDYMTALEQYPQWFIREERAFINDLCRRMITDIITANNIYITTQADADQRRSHQNAAIASVETLLQELTFLLDIIPQINADALKPLIEMADREIALLKGWRKSDNRIRKSLPAC